MSAQEEEKKKETVPLVDVRRVSFQYPNKSKLSVKNVSFQIFPTDRVLLLGANGSGKSTLLSLLAGARKPLGGRGKEEGEGGGKLTIQEMRVQAKERERRENFAMQDAITTTTTTTAIIGATTRTQREEESKGKTRAEEREDVIPCPGSAQGSIRVLGRDPFNETSLTAHITLIGAAWPPEAIFGNTVDRVASIPAHTPSEHVDDLRARRQSIANALHLSLSRFVDHMSSGERRRVQLLHGLLPEASLFLLDECSTDIDVVERKTVLEWVREEVNKRRGACVYATHVLDGVDEWATHVALMREGELVEYLPLSAFFQQYSQIEDEEDEEEKEATKERDHLNAEDSHPVPPSATAADGTFSSSSNHLHPTSHHYDPVSNKRGSLRHHVILEKKNKQKKKKQMAEFRAATCGRAAPPHGGDGGTSLPSVPSSFSSSSFSNAFFEGDAGFSLENFVRDFMTSTTPSTYASKMKKKDLRTSVYPHASSSTASTPSSITPNSKGSSASFPSASPIFPRRFCMEGVTAFLSQTVHTASSPTMGAAPSCLNYREVSFCKRPTDAKESPGHTIGDSASTTPTSTSVEEENEREEDPAALFSTIPAIDCRHLMYKHIFSDMSFSIPQGARVLLCGCNGSGKSTLLQILGGRQFFPNHHAALRILGHPCYVDMRTMNGLVSFGGSWWSSPPEGEVYVHEMIDLTTARAHYLRELLAVEMNWNLQEVSSGEARRVQLLHQLLEDKPIVLLDEATADLDVDQRHRLLSFLFAESVERGVTVVYATHIFNGLDGWPTMTMIMDGASGGVHGIWYDKESSDGDPNCGAEEKGVAPGGGGASVRRDVDGGGGSQTNEEIKRGKEGRQYGLEIKRIPIELAKLKEREIF